MTASIFADGKALPCIVCGRELRHAMGGGSTNQPNDGLCFDTGGHYGSTVFDMMDGELQISVCDPCVVAAAKAGKVARVYTHQKRPAFESVPFDPEWER
jgi:hypothetical protein